jgi:ABC-type multidrug transport system fused ATPase/permease subunit
MSYKKTSVDIEEPNWIKIAEEWINKESRYNNVCQKEWEEFQKKFIINFGTDLFEIADQIAELDVLSNFAKISLERDYQRPELLDSTHAFFDFKNLRHPIVEESSFLLEDFVPNDVSLDKTKDIMCIYGANSAGKSTLLDAILGIKNPRLGEVLISERPPLEAFSEWPSKVGFVPQETYIRKGTIRENIALGFSSSEIDDCAVIDAVERAQLSEFVASYPEGIYSEIGESGSTISGGQRQRLGIARALYTKPKIIILDEATSSLDATTEHAITSAIKGLKGSVTLIVVAHRLSTIQDADTVIYLAHGCVVAQGSFEEVRQSVPDFEEQAQVMGL